MLSLLSYRPFHLSGGSSLFSVSGVYLESTVYSVGIKSLCFHSAFLRGSLGGKTTTRFFCADACHLVAKGALGLKGKCHGAGNAFRVFLGLLSPFTPGSSGASFQQSLGFVKLFLSYYLRRIILWVCLFLGR